MGYAKRLVKSKIRVEGTQLIFVPTILTTFMLRPQSSRNEVEIESERLPTTLEVFDQLGRHFGKESTHWLTDEELTSAHVHVLINCTEVQPYLE